MCVCVGRRANVGKDRERVGRKKQIKEEGKKRQKRTENGSEEQLRLAM